MHAPARFLSANQILAITQIEGDNTDAELMHNLVCAPISKRMRNAWVLLEACTSVQYCVKHYGFANSSPMQLLEAA